MNQLESLREYLMTRFPEIAYTTEKPANPDGFWHLDLLLGTNTLIVIEWQENYGFGLHNFTNRKNSPVFGEGPQEIFTDFESVFRRISEILENCLP